MEIRKPKTGEYLNIYSARLTFVKRKNGQVSENVRVTIRYNIKGPKKKRELPIPKDIDIDELNWIKKTGIAVYYREKRCYQSNSNENYYYTSGDVSISTNLGQKLEDLVKEACFGNSS